MSLEVMRGRVEELGLVAEFLGRVHDLVCGQVEAGTGGWTESMHWAGGRDGVESS